MQPLRGHLRLTIEKNDNVSPKVAVESALEVVGVTISETQYHLLLGILSQFSAGMVLRARAHGAPAARLLPPRDASRRYGEKCCPSTLRPRLVARRHGT